MIRHQIASKGVQNLRNNTSSDNSLMPSDKIKPDFKTVAREIGSGPVMPPYIARVGKYAHSPAQVPIHIPKPVNEQIDFLQNQLERAQMRQQDNSSMF